MLKTQTYVVPESKKFETYGESIEQEDVLNHTGFCERVNFDEEKNLRWNSLLQPENNLAELSVRKKESLRKQFQFRKTPYSSILPTCAPFNYGLLSSELLENSVEEKALQQLHMAKSDGATTFRFGQRSKIPYSKRTLFTNVPESEPLQESCLSQQNIKQKARLYLQVLRIMKSCGLVKIHQRVQEMMKKNMEIQSEIEQMHRELRQVTMAFLQETRKKSFSLNQHHPYFPTENKQKIF